MSLKYEWIINSGTHKKGSIVELSEEEAKMRLILKHIKEVVEKKEVKIQTEIERVVSDIGEYFGNIVRWNEIDFGSNVLCFNNVICFDKKDKRKVLKILPDLLDAGYVIDNEKEIIIKEIKSDFVGETKLKFI